MIDLDNTEQRDGAAAEFVLGTLDGHDLAQFEAALRRDPGLRALVGAWQDRLLPLTRRTAPVRPSPPLWRRIEASVTARAPTLAPTTPMRAARGDPPWWRRLGLWQGLSGVALAGALAMGALLVRQSVPEPASGRYLAVLQSPDRQSTGWIVELRQGGTMRLVPVGDVGSVPAGRAWQFWTKAEGAAGPTSLGLVRAGQTLELPVTRLPAVGARQLFEITLEPETGSPTGRPTGPILYVGSTVAL